MTKIPELHPILGAWLLEGPLSAQVPAYVARLKRGRYATHTCARCLNAVAHFAHWMSMCHLPACMFDEGCIDQFLRCHLPRCDCLGGALRTPNEAHAALVLMLEILRVEGVIARPTAPAGPIADELRSYDAHMRDARGLASGTRTGRLRIVERLLVSQFAARPVVVGELQTDDIRQFIADQLDALGSTSNAITIASTLRAYLRYRATCGEAVQPLLAVIDWRQGTVTLKRTKSRRQELLPLPTTTPAGPWRRISAMSAPRQATLRCSCAARHPTTSPSASMPSGGSFATPSAAQASLMAAAMPCATPWPAASSTRAARSRRWPTCCATGR